MPEYDYHCESCGETFTVELSISEHERLDRAHAIHCPKCESTDVRHLIGAVSVVTSKKS